MHRAKIYIDEKFAQGIAPIQGADTLHIDIIYKEKKCAQRRNVHRVQSTHSFKGAPCIYRVIQGRHKGDQGADIRGRYYI